MGQSKSCLDPFLQFVETPLLVICLVDIKKALVELCGNAVGAWLLTQTSSARLAIHECMAIQLEPLLPSPFLVPLSLGLHV